MFVICIVWFCDNKQPDEASEPCWRNERINLDWVSIYWTQYHGLAIKDRNQLEFQTMEGGKTNIFSFHYIFLPGDHLMCGSLFSFVLFRGMGYSREIIFAAVRSNVLICLKTDHCWFHACTVHIYSWNVILIFVHNVCIKIW